MFPVWCRPWKIWLWIWIVRISIWAVPVVIVFVNRFNNDWLWSYLFELKLNSKKSIFCLNTTMLFYFCGAFNKLETIAAFHVAFLQETLKIQFGVTVYDEV